jgi:Flp pilus assembly pilin Flp
MTWLSEEFTPEAMVEYPTLLTLVSVLTWTFVQLAQLWESMKGFWVL